MITQPLARNFFEPSSKDVPPSRAIAYLICFGVSVLGVPLLLLGLLFELVFGDPGPLYPWGIFIIVFPWALWVLIKGLTTIFKKLLLFLR
ncbi:MAG: hypothetical protein ACFFB3_22140 [Candidatus Hodarchaeota archaeon]